MGNRVSETKSSLWDLSKGLLGCNPTSPGENDSHDYDDDDEEGSDDHWDCQDQASPGAIALLSVKAGTRAQVLAWVTVGARENENDTLFSSFSARNPQLNTYIFCVCVKMD